VKKLENLVKLESQNNVFLIDWLTVVFKDQTVFGVQHLLGLSGGDIPWENKHSFVYGYPMTTYWNSIAIRWGADCADFYTSDDQKKAEEKVRYDMGICLEMSGQGCRAFETHGRGNWIDLLTEISESFGSFTITRLDLAYDDHTGILDIHRLESDVRDRNLVCKARNTRVIWSDDWDENIQGLTIEIGSRQSSVLVRIYDKAAERGFDHSKHWVRVELQLRKDRAIAAVLEILKHKHIGIVAGGILRNYCTFRSPTQDSNKYRWPLTDYWDKLLLDMERIRIFISPGEPYNYSKTEKHMLLQYGQAFIAYYRMHGEINSFLYAAMRMFPVLKSKYETAISDFKLLENERKRRADEVRSFYGFRILDDDDPLAQVDLVDIFGPDLGGSSDEKTP